MTVAIVEVGRHSVSGDSSLVYGITSLVSFDRHPGIWVYQVWVGFVWIYQVCSISGTKCGWLAGVV